MLDGRGATDIYVYVVDILLGNFGQGKEVNKIEISFLSGSLIMCYLHTNTYIRLRVHLNVNKCRCIWVIKCFSRLL